MVHPLMRSTTPDTSLPDHSPEKVADPIIDLLPRLHVLVIGPGLGRDPLMHETIVHIIGAAKKRNMPFVLDADGLGLVQSHPELVKGYKQAVLTPNVVEFARLAKAVGVELGGGGKGSQEGLSVEERGKDCKAVANALGGVLVIQKGQVDYISNGKEVLVSDLEGGRKRSGGQGDTLTGCLGTLLAWRGAYLEKLWDVEGDLKEDELLMLVAFGGSAITRECSRLAFMKKGRSLQASDLTDEVQGAFKTVVGETEDMSKL